MMGCSQKYRELVVTHGGLTIDNQTGFIPTHFDYDEWLALLRRLGLRTLTHLQRLKSVAPEAGELREEYEGLEHQWGALRSRYDALPSIWTCCFLYEDTTRNIGDAASMCVETVCLMEAIDKAIASAGSKPPVEPKTHGKAATPAAKLGGLGLLAGLGVGAYIYWKSQG